MPQHLLLGDLGPLLLVLELEARAVPARLRHPLVALPAWSALLVLWHSYGRYAPADQHTGGGVMLVERSFVMLGLVVSLLLRVLRESEARQQLLDAG